MSKISELTEKLAAPIVADEGCSLWDVEYVKEAGTWYLRIYIDKPEGICINDCENISRRLDPLLDEEDYIPDSYVFEVCSAGADRVLKRDSDFEAFLGAEVELKLYKAVDGEKAFCGILSSHDAERTVLNINDEEHYFDNSAIAQVRLHVSF